MIIRKACWKDINSIIGLYQLLMQQHKNYDPLYQIHSKALKEYQNFLKKYLHQKNSLILVADKKKKVIGFVVCLIHERQPRFLIKKAVYIYDIYVDTTTRTLGIGTKLLEKVKQWAKKKKIQYIKLEMSPKNKLGFTFWKNKGFHIYQYLMALKISEQ